MARSNGTAPAEGTEVAQATAEKKSKPVSFTVPLDAYAAIKAAADGVNKSVSDFARGIVAGNLGLSLPTITRGGRKRVYASKEERLAAQKETNRKNREKFKALLALYESDPEQIQALLDQRGIKLPAETESVPA